MAEPWKRVKFGEVVRLAREVCRNPGADGVDRVIGLEHLEPGEMRVRSWDDIADGTTFTTRVRPGQLLFGKRRAYQRKVAVADFDAICSGDIYVLESADQKLLLPELLPFICQTESFFEHAVGTSAGSLSPRTNWSSLAQYEFALPSLREQRRLASALATAEAARQAADFLAGSARVAFHAAIEHAYTEAAARFPLQTLEAAVEVGRPITYGILMPGTGFPGGVPVIKVKDFPDGEINQSDLLLTNPAIDHEYRRSRLRAGDVLISIRGTIGRLALVPPELEGANITQDTARLSFPRTSSPSYFLGLLQCASLRRGLRCNIPPPSPAGLPPSKARPRDRIQGLNIGELRRIVVPVPPLAEQVRIADVFDRAGACVTATQKRADQAHGLRSRLVEQALGGGL